MTNRYFNTKIVLFSAPAAIAVKVDYNVKSVSDTQEPGDKCKDLGGCSAAIGAGIVNVCVENCMFPFLSDWLVSCSELLR